MTREQIHKFDDLVSAFWDGQCGEVEFTELALEIGASLTKITEAIGEVREEDGTWGQ